MVDRLIQAAIEVDEGPGAPKASCQFFAGDEFARLLEQREQELDRLIAERLPTATVRQFPAPGVDSECPELVDTSGPTAGLHAPEPARPPNLSPATFGICRPGLWRRSAAPRPIPPQPCKRRITK